MAVDDERLHRLALEGDLDAAQARVAQLRRRGDEAAIAALLGQVARPLSGFVAEAPLEVAPAVALSAAVLEALDAVHAGGELMVELLPSRIFVVTAPAAAPWHAPRHEVIDLGPRRPWPPPPIDVLFENDALIEHLRYAAPERLQGRDDLDARADLYAVALMLHELWSGQLPWPNDPLMASLSARCYEANAPSPALWMAPERRHTPLERVLAQALARDPTQRFDTATALRQALLEAARQPAWHDATAPFDAPDPSLPPIVHYGLPPGPGPWDPRPRGLRGWLRRLFRR